MPTRPIAFIAEPTVAAEAKGVVILRSIGSERLVLLDPFLLFDHLTVEPAPEPSLGFPRHPHRGIETLTYVVEGWVNHRDSLGNDSRVHAGGAQWMRAGAGIFHEEFLEAGAVGSEALQVWFNLPADLKRAPAEYQAVTADAIPTVSLPGGAVVQVVAGALDGVVGPVTRTGIDATYFVVTLPAGATVQLPVPQAQTAFAYLYKGRAQFGEKEIHAGRLVILSDAPSDAGTDTLVVSATSDTDAQFIVVSAAPLREPVVQYRSSVMNTASEIGQVITDLENGTFA